MDYTTHPVWKFAPNWGEAVLETLKWKTDVLGSAESAEQRISRRLTPRRTFEATFILDGVNRQKYVAQMSQHGASVWLIPVWQNIAPLLETAEAGTARLVFDTRLREYAVNQYVAIRPAEGNGPWEIAQIASIDDGGLNLISNLDRTWRKGTRIYPTALASIVDKAESKKEGAGVFVTTVRFQLEQINTRPSVCYAPVYASTWVLEPRPDDSEQHTHTFSRDLDSVDNETSLMAWHDLAGRERDTVGYRWAFRGRTKSDAFRRLLYALRGRQTSCWVPTFMDDLTPATMTSGVKTGIFVQNVGYSALGLDAKEKTKYLRIELLTGAITYHTVTSAAEVSDEVELLNISPSITLPTGGNTRIRSISYMVRSRLAQDSIEIQHETDVQGLTECSVRWYGPVAGDMVATSSSVGADIDAVEDQRFANRSLSSSGTTPGYVAQTPTAPGKYASRGYLSGYASQEPDTPHLFAVRGYEYAYVTQTPEPTHLFALNGYGYAYLTQFPEPPHLFAVRAYNATTSLLYPVDLIDRLDVGSTFLGGVVRVTDPEGISIGFQATGGVFGGAAVPTMAIEGVNIGFSAVSGVFVDALVAEDEMAISLRATSGVFKDVLRYEFWLAEELDVGSTFLSGDFS